VQVVRLPSDRLSGFANFIFVEGIIVEMLLDFLFPGPNDFGREPVLDDVVNRLLDGFSAGRWPISSNVRSTAIRTAAFAPASLLKLRGLP
jgi:hypothetical protein